MRQLTPPVRLQRRVGRRGRDGARPPTPRPTATLLRLAGLPAERDRQRDERRGPCETRACRTGRAAQRFGDQRPAAAVVARSINVDGAATTRNATAAGPPAAPGWAARTERGAASSHRSAELLPDWRRLPPARNEHAETETTAGALREPRPDGPDALPNSLPLSRTTRRGGWTRQCSRWR